MFKIDQAPSYFFPVTVELAIDGGKFQKSTFDAEFNRLSKTKMKEIFDRFPSISKDVEDPITDNEILDLVFIGWKGVVDDAGEPLPYSQTTREALLDVQGVGSAIVRTYFASIAGSKQKN
jgi:hypothetical protein